MLTTFVLTLFLGAEPSGQIAFVRGAEQEDHRVCILDVETREVRPIGPGARDGAPVWSRDGARLAFSSHQENGLGIRVYGADGTELTRPKHGNDWNQRPRWSPDGTRLAYSAGIAPDETIVVCDVGPGEETVWAPGQKGLTRPVWLNDSALITLGMVADGRKISTALFVVTPDDAKLLDTSPDSEDSYFHWAAETNSVGDLVAFESNDGGDREIFVFSFAYFLALDVSNHHAADWNPVWAPNGRTLAFESFRGKRRGIYRVEPELLLVKPVAAAEDSDNWHATWSPDGKWLAFVSNRTGDPEVFVGDAKGKRSIRLTDHPGHDYAPAWRPRPKTEGKQ